MVFDCPTAVFNIRQRCLSDIRSTTVCYVDWFSSFIKRNPILSIRKPERTSQARAAAVNHVVIDKFYDDLFNLCVKYKFPPEKIFNCDETNNPTVVDPQNIVAQKGAKVVIILLRFITDN